MLRTWINDGDAALPVRLWGGADGDPLWSKTSRRPSFSNDREKDGKVCKSLAGGKGAAAAGLFLHSCTRATTPNGGVDATCLRGEALLIRPGRPRAPPLDRHQRRRAGFGWPAIREAAFSPKPPPPPPAARRQQVGCSDRRKVLFLASSACFPAGPSVGSSGDEPPRAGAAADTDADAAAGASASASAGWRAGGRSRAAWPGRQSVVLWQCYDEPVTGDPGLRRRRRNGAHQPGTEHWTGRRQDMARAAALPSEHRSAAPALGCGSRQRAGGRNHVDDVASGAP